MIDSNQSRPVATEPAAEKTRHTADDRSPQQNQSQRTRKPYET
jgi:hypothetical protein